MTGPNNPKDDENIIVPAITPRLYNAGAIAVKIKILLACAIPEIRLPNTKNGNCDINNILDMEITKFSSRSGRVGVINLIIGAKRTYRTTIRINKLIIIKFEIVETVSAVFSSLFLFLINSGIKAALSAPVIRISNTKSGILNAIENKPNSSFVKKLKKIRYRKIPKKREMMNMPDKISVEDRMSCCR